MIPFRLFLANCWYSPEFASVERIATSPLPSPQPVCSKPVECSEVPDTSGFRMKTAVGRCLPVALGSFAMAVSWFAAVPTLHAQPPGGFPGGAPGGPPPGMSFGGGPPMMGGFGGDRGRDGGGSRGGWGGGSSGGGGFGGGGFDPSQFISRMDTNGNGSIDPEEAQGPARFMLDRMARNNPKIDLTKPIPITVITEAFQQMRSGGMPGSPGGDMGDESVEIAASTLVPTFGIKLDKTPVPGFGAAGATMAIKVEERDLREADERLRRYDRNADGMLDENEVKEARWNEPLSQWDRNKDGKLSRQEVASRYARRRDMKETQESRQRSPDEARNRGQTAAAEEPKLAAHPFEKQASFRIGDSSGNVVRPSGLPEWFIRDDANNDNQVSMNEFARKWDESTLEEFSKFDTNQDGYITPKEVLAGVRKWYLKSSSSGSSSPASTTDSSKATAGTTGDAKAASGTTASSSSAGSLDAELRDWSKKRIAKTDKDKNGFLTPDEFKDSTTTFGDVDKNGNGQIDLDEYTAYRKARSN